MPRRFYGHSTTRLIHFFNGRDRQKESNWTARSGCSQLMGLKRGSDLKRGNVNRLAMDVLTATILESGPICAGINVSLLQPERRAINTRRPGRGADPAGGPIPM